MGTHASKLTISERLIERWHENPVDKSGNYCELHDYLGLTWDEYGEVVLHPTQMDELVRERNPEFTSYVENLSTRSISTVQDATQYLSESSDDSSSLGPHVFSDVEGIDERACILILGRLNSYSDTYPDDEGYNFSTYHDIRLLRQAYTALFDSLRKG
jgi:hypothetical protein